jgi:hypothetical protein
MERAADRVSLHVVENGVDGDEALSRFGGLENLASFALGVEAVDVSFSPDCWRAVLADAARKNLHMKRCSIRSELVGDNYRRSKAVPQQQLPDKLQRGCFVASRLDNNFKNLTFAIDRAPKVHLLSRN